ncbi:MAG: ChaN family lipoprotein [Saprospiraceae bacterium]
MRAFNLLLIILSFTALNGQNNTDELIKFIKDHALTPEQYIIEKFKKNDVVLLGEQHIVKQNLLFVQGLIPLLYKNGVYTIGMEFGAYENQSLLDSLVTAKAYNEKLAEKMMFDYNVTWAYKEYVGMAKAAWEFNRTLPKNARTFRILNLSYIYHWEKFNGKRDVATMQAVFSQGTIDQFRANVIEKEVLSKKEKILALVGTPHAYTKYGSPYFLYNADNFCAYDYNWLGNRLYAKYPNKIFNIILHQAFTKKIDDRYIPISPLDGKIETLMAQNGNKPVGFDLINTPVGKLKDESIHSLCYNNFTINQLFDGYIFLQPLKALEGCTIIPDFVNEKNIEQALQQFPDPDWHQKVSTLQEMIDFIEANAKRIKF